MEPNLEATTGVEEGITRDKLISDLKTVAHDAEELLKATAGDLGEKTKEARERLEAALGRAKETYRVVQDKAYAGARATDECIRANPYPAIGAAFGVGVLLGVLLRRR